jgi:dolichol-phosphate mannosyltransferase
MTDLSILLPSLNEGENLKLLLPQLHNVVTTLQVSYEVIVIEGGFIEETTRITYPLNAKVIPQKLPGYGGALTTGFQEASGCYILTLDADLSHQPEFIKSLWQKRNDAEIIVASRYTKGGSAKMPLFRKVLSRVLNYFFTKGLFLPLEDLSSGFRLYRKDILRELNLQSVDFEALEEILIKLYAQGYRIAEVPFAYTPREKGSSHARIFRVGLRLVKTFFKMWQLRNSIYCADYEYRAYDSRIPLQRYWQRNRYKLITASQMLTGKTLDIGCGSSRILQSLGDAIGLDIQFNKLRYIKPYGKPLIQGSLTHLPFRDQTFDCIVCSQVIEQVKGELYLFDEIYRVLKNRGRLILGTTDYATPTWCRIEPLYKRIVPDSYYQEPLHRFTKNTLSNLLTLSGFKIIASHYICKAELILIAEKHDGSSTS